MDELIEEVEIVPDFEGNDSDYTDATRSISNQVVKVEVVSTTDGDFRELSQEDVADLEAVSAMYKDGFQCCKEKCNAKIPKHIAVRHRYCIQELTKSEKKLVITAQLQMHRRIPDLLTYYGDQTKRKKSRLKNGLLRRRDMRYFFYDLPICKDMYSFLHVVGKHEFKNICQHLDTNGLTPHVHQLSGKTPNRSNVLQPKDIDKTVTFIKSYGYQYGVPLSERLPQFHDHAVVRLSPEHTKQVVYRRYCDGLSEGDKRIARSTFSGIWRKYCPFITCSGYIQNSKTQLLRPAVPKAKRAKLKQPQTAQGNKLLSA